MEEAITNEINKNYIGAVLLYENEIGNHYLDALPDCFINLSFLYWSFAFQLFEFVIPNNIPEHWCNIGGDKFLKTLDMGLLKFPNNAELHFWRKYFLHVSFGKEFSESDCLSLIKKYKVMESKTPFFFLYVFNKDKYKNERDEILKICEQLPTAKNNYIKSVVSG